MRRMSFSLTTEQVRNQTKTVTRRQGWKTLRCFTLIQPIEKGMGLKKGEKQVLIGLPIYISYIRTEPINAITQADVILEGFPDMTPAEFITMYCKANKCKPTDECRRIQFDYLTEKDLGL